jgi:UDP-glucose 4-epimerase
MNDTRRVMVTGAAGSVGRLVVEHLAGAGFDVHAVDRREESGFPNGVSFHRADVKKRSFEDVLKKVRPHALVHHARVRSFQVDAAERHRVNFEGTVHALETALKTGVRKIVFPSRHTVYGALPDQPHFVTEDHPPSAGRTFPEIQDLVAADLYVCGMLWRHPEAEVVVLRPVNVLGTHVNTLFSSYLAPARVFTIAGYDPLYQVLHEDDLALAIELSLAPGLRGVFNVTGPGEVPLHVIVEESGARRVPLPEPLIKLVQGRLGFARVPQGALDFLKFPCTVDGRRFVQATGFVPRHSLKQTIRSMRARRE